MPIRSQFNSDADFLNALEDWFAGLAMMGLVQRGVIEPPVAGLVERSYQIAEAMIARRSTKRIG